MGWKTQIRIYGVLCFLGMVQTASAVTFLPESHHHQFTTFGLFHENQSTVVLRNASRAWGVLGTSLAVAEISDWPVQPQFVISGSASTSFRFNERVDTLLTETIDARVGAQIDLSVSEVLRFSFGWQHQSGHVSDNIEDLRMVGPNLGNEIVFGRILYDFHDLIRVGATLRPVIGSEPPLKFFAADEFIEWMPWGQATSFRKPTAFIALGLEQYGVNRVTLSKHLQLGVYFGSHFDREHHAGLRAVLGYYAGVDPRLKYAQYQLSRAEFGYLGLMFDI